MRRTLLLLLLAASARAEERVFVETVVPRPTCFVHEPIRVVLRIGFDRAFFEEHAVQMFQRDFDVPVQVQASWLRELPGATPRASDDVGDGLSLVLNGDAVGAARGEEREVDGRRFTVVEIGRTYLPDRPGALALAAPVLRYVYATGFREDFFEGRVPVDRRDASATGALVTIEVRALPEQGRPAGFTGAVGRFTVHADAAPRAVDAGETLKLTLRIEGEGNLEGFATPRLDGLAHFHVYGMLDDQATPRRTIVYDVAPLRGGVAEVPPIAFAYFDPRAAAYRTVHSKPIPLTVRGPAPAEPQPEKETAPDGWPAWLWGLPLAVVLALWLLARRAKPAAAPDADAAFRERAATDVAAAFTEYLAARLGCPPASVIAPDLEARLARAGVPGDLARRAAALVERLVGARYGGASSDADHAEAEALVTALETAASRSLA